MLAVVTIGYTRKWRPRRAARRYRHSADTLLYTARHWESDYCIGMYAVVIHSSIMQRINNTLWLEIQRSVTCIQAKLKNLQIFCCACFNFFSPDHVNQFTYFFSTISITSAWACHLTVISRLMRFHRRKINFICHNV